MNKLFACVCACAGKFRIESSARWRYLFFGLCTYTMLSVWMCLYLGNESGLCTCVCSRIWFLENISLDGQNAKTRLLSCTSQTIGFAFSSTSCIFDLFCSFPFTRLFPKIAPLVCCFFLLRLWRDLLHSRIHRRFSSPLFFVAHSPIFSSSFFLCFFFLRADEKKKCLWIMNLAKRCFQKAENLSKKAKIKLWRQTEEELRSKLVFDWSDFYSFVFYSLPVWLFYRIRSKFDRRKNKAGESSLNLLFVCLLFVLHEKKKRELSIVDWSSNDENIRCGS